MSRFRVLWYVFLLLAVGGVHHRYDVAGVMARLENQAADQPLRNLTSACSTSAPRGTRVLLVILVPPFHGSSALEGVLLSSPKVASLCSGRTWQCEGQTLLRHHDKPFYEPRNWTGHFTEVLSVFSHYWNLSRPVLLDKSPSSWNYARRIYESASRATLPEQMTSHGVERLVVRFILMWRPLCLRAIASFDPPYEREVRKLETQAASHRELSAMGVPVLVVNYADLLWRTDRTQRRINSYFPCMQPVDLDYTPRLGVDIWEENDWKARGTVRAFGKRHPPQECCRYNLAEGHCAAGPPRTALGRRGDDAESYLRRYS